MREILFRGQRIDNGEWVEGYYFEMQLCDGEGRCSYIKIDGSSGIKVNPATVGQYTGLKDKNGVKIFEGDVLELGNIHLEVLFLHGCFCVQIPRMDATPILWDSDEPDEDGTVDCPIPKLDYLDSIIVIGNKFDNPELLTN